MTKTVLQIPSDNPIFGTSHANYEAYGYSPAVRAGGLLFIAGEVGILPDGSIPASAAEQTEVALRRMTEVLRLAGLTPADLVEVVSYHVDLAGTIDEFLPVKARFSESPFPTWSIIGVQALALPDLKIEIRAVAAYSNAD